MTDRTLLPADFTTEEVLSVIRAAISYAPLGCRDTAGRALDALTDPTTQVHRLLSQEAELKELRDFSYWAAYALKGISGEKRMVAPTYEAEARAFLAHHARTVEKLFKRREAENAEVRRN